MQVSALYLGDGTVAGVGLADPSTAFPELMKGQLGPDGITVGVEWQGAEALLATLDGIFDQYEPQGVYLVTGQTDVLTEPGDVKGAAKINDRLARVVAKCKERAPAADIRIATPFHNLQAQWPELYDSKVILPLICANAGVQCVDILQQWFDDPAGYSSKFNGLYYPNEAGHADLAAAFLAQPTS